jgi:hypothetical protein
MPFIHFTSYYITVFHILLSAQNPMVAGKNCHQQNSFHGAATIFTQHYPNPQVIDLEVDTWSKLWQLWYLKP